MPVKIVPLGNGKYKVVTPNGVHSKGTTLEKAKRQRNLLNAVEHNPDWKPTKNK